tara:strand:+ start:532 stop:1782 length:1251 start_codon:yes stop_codon:yes gene_type:complete
MSISKNINNMLKEVAAQEKLLTLGTPDYSTKIDELINDLKLVKDTIKKSENKKFYRKEAARIQSAIQALKFLKKKSDRLAQKNSSQIMMSESEILDIVSKRGIVKVQRIDESGFVRRQISKLLDRSKDVETTSEIDEVIKIEINSKGAELKNDIANKVLGTSGEIVPELIAYTNEIKSNFMVYYFYDVLNLSKGLFSTFQPPTLPGAPIPPDLEKPGVPYYITDAVKFGEAPLASTVNYMASKVNTTLNQIIRGFNQLFKGISDIPETATYSNYAVNQIFTDISLIINPHGYNIDSESIQRSLALNMDYKTSSLNPFERDTSVKAPEESLKKLAKRIARNLLKYFVTQLKYARKQLQYFLSRTHDPFIYSSHYWDGAAKKVLPPEYSAPILALPDIETIVKGIDTVANNLQEIRFK